MGVDKGRGEDWRNTASAGAIELLSKKVREEQKESKRGKALEVEVKNQEIRGMEKTIKSFRNGGKDKVRRHMVKILGIQRWQKIFIRYGLI